MEWSRKKQFSHETVAEQNKHYWGEQTSSNWLTLVSFSGMDNP